MSATEEAMLIKLEKMRAWYEFYKKVEEPKWVTQ